MSIILDLGGAPAHEACAQLGQTPGFAVLNALEVAVYRAALQARFGPPPEGCGFVLVDNHHDFGRYRTLGLAIDRPDAPAVIAYAEAVEQGLTSWVEAGFAPPVSYDGAVGHAHRQHVGDIVVGALATTRPGPDGRFPLADFAVLHANLRRAYPAEVARFDALGIGIAPAETAPCEAGRPAGGRAS